MEKVLERVARALVKTLREKRTGSSTKTFRPTSSKK